MSLLPKSKAEFSQKEYWDKFFKQRGKEAFEWYGEYPELSKHLHKYIKHTDQILIVGCGNSTLGRDLYDAGCHSITNIDISKVVVDQMIAQTTNRPGLRYLEMDALKTSFKDESFNVILDKGTLDALMPNSSKETVKTIEKYFEEINRLMMTAGRYVCISLLQEHILKKLLDYFPKYHFMFRAVRCHDSEESLPVFMVVCTKFKQLPRQIIEINLTTEDRMQKCQSPEELQEEIASSQRVAFICSKLQKSSLTTDDEITLVVYQQQTNEPRYTIYVVETYKGAKNQPYAAFIVPEGREAEWLFSTQTGRKNLLSMTNHKRLTIVTMHRGQQYPSLDDVKIELADIVKQLAPSTMNQKIPFLTLGSDLGKRTILHRGTSDFSGDYVVEDIEHDNGKKFRRLFYMSSQLVIQSEAKLKTIKKGKKILDLLTLTCQHHIFMTIAAGLSSKSNIVVLGLGGGGLCSFLKKYYAQSTITAVEIDQEMLKIAKDWFGFVEDDRMIAKVQDGLDFIRNLPNSKPVDVILCDVDNKSSEIGMSCPPAAFIDNEILNIVSKSNGIFIVNVVLRDTNLRGDILAKFSSFFKSVISYKLSEDLNEVFICSNSSESPQSVKDSLKLSATKINAFFAKNNVEDQVDVEEFVNNLKIIK